MWYCVHRVAGVGIHSRNCNTFRKKMDLFDLCSHRFVKVSFVYIDEKGVFSNKISVCRVV